MEVEREKRLRGGPKDRGLDDAPAGQLLEEHQPARPGKRTLIEQQLDHGLAETAGAPSMVGRRTPLAGPRLAFDDFRSRGLHELVAALTSMGCGRGLVEAALSAASKATRPPLPSLTTRQAPPDPAGQAMWQVAERRAATLYRRAADSGYIEAEDPAVGLALARAGGGQPLPEAVRRKMELELGISLDRVRIHTDSVAASAAHVVRARAFTVGEDIFFADGAYAPETPDGQRLLAHELTHVVQAYQGRTEIGGTGIRVSNPDESLEREADAFAERIGERRVAPDGVMRPAPVVAASSARARVLRKATAPGRSFGQASTPVGKLGRVQAPDGVFLRVQPMPGAASPTARIPFNALVYVESRTTQERANERWCYVIATELGAAGFCEERYLAIDPPDPLAKLRRTQERERLAVIAEKEYGPAEDENNSRLYVQALYIANRDRAGVKLEQVDLSFKDRAIRGDDEEKTLKVYKGAQVIEGTSIWIPSKEFIERLKAAGAVTGGSSYVMEAWYKAKGYADDVVDGVKYAAGFIAGMLEGAFNAIVDLFKGAAEMIKAVVEVIWSLITGNLGRINDMLMGWVGKMKLAWEHRDQIADEFLKKWNAESMWDRGLFQGEVLGWVMMTVLLILVTMGEDAPAAISGIAVRWPQLVKLLRTVDTLGDVTTYLGAATKTVNLSKEAAAFVAGKVGKARRAAEHMAGDLGDDASRAGKKADNTIEHIAGLGRTVSQRSVELLGQSHTLRVVDRGKGTFSLVLCSDCGFVLKEIDAILAQTAAKGPTKSLRKRLERLRSKVADLEKQMSSGAMKQTEGVAKLDQIAAHLGDISKKFPSANQLCVFCSFKGQIDYDLIAKNLGYERIGGRSHGQPVYRRGNEFISPDVDDHHGGIWKKATGDASNLRNKSSRDGTFNEDLTEMVGP